MDIIAINESFRFIDVVDDLITIDSINPTKYDFNVPTIVPKTWKEYVHVTQKEYDIEFKRKHSSITHMLKTVKNVVVAGGAAARPLYVSNKDINTDVDIFIYGILDEQLFWEKVNEIVHVLMKHTIGNDQNCRVTQKMKKGIIIIETKPTYSEIHPEVEYQIILRMYHTLSSIIHAFDIPSCCVAYDGTTTYVTTLGAYAHTNQVNLVYTPYRSITYETRLIKYFKRGFGIGLIGYDIDKADEQTELIHKCLNIEVYHRKGNHVIGVVMQVDGLSFPVVDYDNIIVKISTYNNLIKQIQCIENTGLILHEGKYKEIDYTLFYDADVCKIIELYPIGIEMLVRMQCSKIQRTKLRFIKNLHLPHNIILELIVIILIENESVATQKIIDILMEQIYLHSKYTPEWIIIQDPQRQYTASLNPIVEDPEKWYGDGYYIK